MITRIEIQYYCPLNIVATIQFNVSPSIKCNIHVLSSIHGIFRNTSCKMFGRTCTVDHVGLYS